MMNRLTANVLNDLKWEHDAIEAIGLISATPQHGVEGIFFMEEMGVDPRAVTLLMLWGETAECIKFDEHVPEECGLGAVILPATGVILPTVRMPSLDNDWWVEPLNQAFAATVFASLVVDGRAEVGDTDPFVFVTPHATWN